MFNEVFDKVYLWPFAEAVKAGVGSVMCSYNKINQTQACQNSKLINGLLKGELGFQGDHLFCPFSPAFDELKGS